MDLLVHETSVGEYLERSSFGISEEDTVTWSCDEV